MLTYCLRYPLGVDALSEVPHMDKCIVGGIHLRLSYCLRFPNGFDVFSEVSTRDCCIT